MAFHPLTLEEYLNRSDVAVPGDRPAFLTLLFHIALAGKILARDLRLAGLLNILGTTGETNVQGESVKKLDHIANEAFVEALQRSGVVGALASEEMEKPLMVSSRQHSPYVVLFDPLDGSSNTDVNNPLGSIFSVLTSDTDRPTEADLLRKGTEQAAAGYLLFGPSTMLVIAIGTNVHGFTLDPALGEYVLSHEDMRIPARGKVYAANEGNYRKWSEGMKAYFDHVKTEDKAGGRPYSGRYSGCLVADVHRILLTGGIYLYPGEVGKPEGKLRLLYEADPLALIVERAGGRASTGTMRILDVEPKKLHQRVPLLIGSREDVLDAEQFIQGRRSS
ncbi:MAG TPA: class 1 fructose-bisphosphatase [Nitrospira sp.]|nr:class 1 fructose-bisphosphatase [Nitrospira sp.]